MTTRPTTSRRSFLEALAAIGLAPLVALSAPPKPKGLTGDVIFRRESLTFTGEELGRMLRRGTVTFRGCVIRVVGDVEITRASNPLRLGTSVLHFVGGSFRFAASP